MTDTTAIPTPQKYSDEVSKISQQTGLPAELVQRKINEENKPRHFGQECSIFARSKVFTFINDDGKHTPFLIPEKVMIEHERDQKRKAGKRCW